VVETWAAVVVGLAHRLDDVVPRLIFLLTLLERLRRVETHLGTMSTNVEDLEGEGDTDVNIESETEEVP
jgi:hypothetical protein